MKELHRILLQLVRLGIGTSAESVLIPNNMDWEALTALAEEQGLKAVALDGLNKLPADAYSIPIELKLQWIGEVLNDYEYHYELYLRAIADLAGFYSEHGLKMMVLKGYACSLDWPRPDHRPTGDIDIWQFGKQRIADEMLTRETGIEIDSSHHHHTVFEWKEFSVENHYDFINVYHHKSHVALEKELKRLGEDDSHWVELNGERLYLPSADLHALFLLRHGMLHFCFGRFSLRNLLDWAFFVKAHKDEVDWDWLLGELEEHGMRPMFDLFNAICVEDLGFDMALFPVAEVDGELKKRVLKEIMSSEFSEEEPKGFFLRIAFKYRRWRANGWKHKLCYKESMWSAFCSGVWLHLLKPASI